MKSFIAVFIAVILLITACNNKKPNNPQGNTETLENKSAQDIAKDNLEKMSGTGDDMKKRMEDLQKLPPLSLDELKKILPEELNGIKRSNYSATAMGGTGVVSGKYKMNDESSIEIVVYDCAGPMGVGIYSAQFMAFNNFEQEDDNGYTKTTTFDGNKAVERFEKNNNEYNITYFTGNRFLINLKGENTTLDELKAASKNINLK